MGLQAGSRWLCCLGGRAKEGGCRGSSFASVSWQPSAERSPETAATRGTAPSHLRPRLPVTRSGQIILENWGESLRGVPVTSNSPAAPGVNINRLF